MNDTTPAEAERISEHLWCIDTDQVRAHMAAAYLIGDGECFAFVECGTNAGVPRMLALLDELGIRREQISHVIPTHVHLDHAGGAGALMQALPEATLVIHPRGARHMIDPAALWKGVVGVYGEDNAREMYGELIPVPEARVLSADSGTIVEVGSRALEIMDSPGHARHHFSVWDAQTRGWFTGDTFGLSYREMDGPNGHFVLPTTTPVQFDPEAWQHTIDGYMAKSPQWMYLTHYSRVGHVPQMADALRESLNDYAAIGRSLKDSPSRHAAIVDALTAHAIGKAQQFSCPLSEAAVLELLRYDVELNAQGIGVWLDREAA